MEQKKQCGTCKEIKLLDQFGNNKRSLDGKQRYCKECQAKSDRKHYDANYVAHYETRKTLRKNNAKKIVDAKKGKVCFKCGDSRHYVLEFHHIDPSAKEDNVSNMYACSPKKAIEEMKKCILLCANCHREFHYKQRTLNVSLDVFLEAKS